jgi:N-acetyl-gamma-glutamyl-phosphate reductase
MAPTKIRVSIVGATGYTGAELLRLVLGHPSFALEAIVGQSRAGQRIVDVLPSFAGLLDGEVEAFDAARVAERSDAVFCALPHGASAPIVEELCDRGVVVFDLSADFRLRDPAVYETWYGKPPTGRFGSAAYGLVELNRDVLRTASLVAVPGCYPTSAILALAPLLSKGLVELEGIVIDAKSGVSGAGRSPLASTHFPETSEGIRAYKIASHRHTPEIEQELSAAAGADVRVLFTPHLVPATRGILSTIYAMAKPGVTAAECTEAARALYEGSPSVVVRDPGVSPDTLWVRGSNRVQLAYAHDARTGRVIALSVIDNLVKGAAGQAVQCANVRFGLDEGAGLMGAPQWP